MALPYPSMSFVPLDILSADELNQMAANDQYLGAKFPITTSDVDWGSLSPVRYSEFWMYAGTTSDLGTAAINGDYTSDAVLKSTTITPTKTGVLLLILNLPCYATGGTAYANIFVDNAKYRSGIPNHNHTMYNTTSICKLVYVTPGQSVTVGFGISINNAPKVVIPFYMGVSFLVVEL